MKCHQNKLTLSDKPTLWYNNGCDETTISLIHTWYLKNNPGEQQ